MNNLTAKPSLVAVIEHEGVELRKQGKRWWGLCPFHSEKTPSFHVNEEKQIFYCFGCQKGGDFIQFIRELKGLSFSEALAYLGVEKGKPPKPDPREVKKRKLLQNFRRWEQDYRNFLFEEFLVTNRFLSGLKTVKDAERFSELYHYRTDIERQLEALDGDEFSKFRLFQEIKHGI